MASSKLQRAVSQALSFHFGGYTIRENSRPSWCLGNNYERLELDFLIEELNIAIEVQGEQHYRFSPGFHATYADFEAQQERDAAKKERCEEYGIILLEIDDALSMAEAIEYILATKEDRRPGINSEIAMVWENRLSNIYLRLREIERNMTTTDIPTFLNQIHNTRKTVIKCIEEYGAFGIDFINPELGEKLFNLLQRLQGRANNIHKKARHKQRAKTLKRFAKLREYRRERDQDNVDEYFAAAPGAQAADAESDGAE